MSLKTQTPIILDLGSSEIKAGYKSDNSSPSIRFPSYIGESKYNKILRVLNKNKSDYKEEFVGDECEPYLGILKLRFPIKHGACDNEKDISLIFNHIFSKLKLSEEKITQHPLLITEPLLNPKENREKIATILFEKYNVPSLIFAYQPSLSLFSFSDTTGVILESGDGVSQICSILNGCSIPSSFIRSDFGGEDVSEYLKRLLKLKGIDFISDTEKLLLHDIKKKYLQISIEGKKDDITPSKFQLPDLTNITIDTEKTLASKVLLNPTLVGKNCLGFHQMISTCIEKVDFELRESLCPNIKMTGGNSCIKGLSEVLHTEIRGLLPKNSNKVKIKAITPNLSTISSWNGGNIIAGLGIFKNLLITKNTWEEKGNDIIHKQTF